MKTLEVLKEVLDGKLTAQATRDTQAGRDLLSFAKHRRKMSKKTRKKLKRFVRKLHQQEASLESPAYRRVPRLTKKKRKWEIFPAPSGTFKEDSTTPVEGVLAKCKAPLEEIS